MIDENLDVGEIPFEKLPVESTFLITQQDISFGVFIDPIKRLSFFSPDEFEVFIQIWVEGFLEKKYNQVVKCGGAGDKGRDIIAYTKNNTWDNYQCKHYNKPLSPSDIWIEIGKLCYFTFNDSYTIPDNYYFVCHKGVGPKLLEYLEKPESLKKTFLENWDRYCKDNISKGKELKLTDEFERYIVTLDFSIFKHVTNLELISPIKESIEYANLFGGGLKKRRETPLNPPSEIANKEMLYTKKMFKAYSQYLNQDINNEEDIKYNEKLKTHFDRQRKYFYTAETLLVLERDISISNTRMVSVKEEIFDTIIDTVDADFDNGFERLKKATAIARKCDLSAHPLLNVTNENDKHGLCHHLANEDRIDWTV